MKRRIFYLIVSLIAAITVATIPASAESNGGVRVMSLGDSITDGLTVPGGYRIGLWQKTVADRYRVDLVGSLSNGPGSLGDHDHEGHSMTIKPNGSGITFGFTAMTNGNSSARPRIVSRAVS